MLTPPDDLAEATLAELLARDWGLTVVSMAYRPLGFGSHHWEVSDGGRDRWFVTVDELEHKRHYRDEPLTVAFGRLRAALGAARRLRDHGYAFVVAPIPTTAGEPLSRIDRYGVAVYPLIKGQSFEWGEFPDEAHRDAVLDLVIAVHSSPDDISRHAMADDFAVPHRDELEAGLDAAGGIPDSGPYARRAALLVTEWAVPIRRLLDRYDELVAEARSRPSRAVLTHGEPHPGNTMLAPGGWLLIDWDTALAAPPERDLWRLDPGDRSVLAAYARATGVMPLPSMLELYRIRWDLADIAMEVGRFRRPHSGTAEDHAAWEILRGTVTGLTTVSSTVRGDQETGS